VGAVSACPDDYDEGVAESLMDDCGVSALTGPQEDTGVREVNSYVARLHLVDLAGTNYIYAVQYEIGWIGIICTASINNMSYVRVLVHVHIICECTILRL
jgi:hypothetical protein